MLHICRIVQRVVMLKDSSMLLNPEAYAAAGGELMVLTMMISWILTYFFNYQAIESNPLQDRVGYNNLCVGWDTFPAKFVAGPLFALIICLYARFVQLDYWRSQLDPDMKTHQRYAVLIGMSVNMFSWWFANGIFSIDPHRTPLGHTMSFVQLVVGTYIGYVCNFIEAQYRNYATGGLAFLIIYGIICGLFGVCATMQMVMYDDTKDDKEHARGPVPWWLMCTLDYAYFACMGLQGFFRPRAPSISATYELVSDDDFILERDQIPRFESSPLFAETSAAPAAVSAAPAAVSAAPAAVP